MLHAKNLPLYLWGEATATAVYVKNRTATNTLKDKTPYEMWYGEKPSVNHLKVFDCSCYVHIAKELRSKWEMNSAKMMMVGYSEGNMAYRVYDSAARKYIRRDVTFDEKSDTNDVIIQSEPTQDGAESDADDDAENTNRG